MTSNAIDLSSPSNIVYEMQGALARSKALVSAAIILAYEMEQNILVNEEPSFKHDRMVYQLEAVEMMLEKYQMLFEDAEARLRKQEFSEVPATPSLATAA